ncbi:MAG: flagellar type III secretion system pore protein FliP [Anaerolineaceae bacterium]|nr:flagellar type III secretion system pore protein FliP [Anaerolineaceae bacterium]
MNTKRFALIISFVLVAVLLSSCSAVEELNVPGVSLSVDPVDGSPTEVTTGIQLLVLLTVISLAPTILVLATSFTRYVIVLSMVRNAVGLQQAPPTQVIVGLALLMTFFTMSPVIDQINENAVQPYTNNEIDQETAIEAVIEPFREFMFRQTRDKDLELFLSMNGQGKPESLDDIGTIILMPAFVISELKTAFTMGFAIYVPFLIIDMVVASVLLSLGMMMLPPSLVSLPFKLLLFVLVDGWYLLAHSLMSSFL